MDILDFLSDGARTDFLGSDPSTSAPTNGLSQRAIQQTLASSTDDLSYLSGVVPKNRFPTPANGSSRTYVRANGQDVGEVAKRTPQIAPKISKSGPTKSSRVRRTRSALVTSKPVRFWDSTEKRTLLILFAHLDVTWTALAELMNAYFATKNGAPFRDKTVTAMYNELSRQRSAKNKEIWTTVAVEIWEENLQEHRDVIRFAERLARRENMSFSRRANIDLERRAHATARRKEKVKVRVEKRVRQPESQIVDLISDSSDAEGDDQAEVKTEPQRTKKRQLPRAVSNISQHQNLNKTRVDPAGAEMNSVLGGQPDGSSAARSEPEVPQLLFRTFNTSSSGLNSATLVRAGFYSSDEHALGLPIAMAPTSLDHEYFLDDCYTHFHRVVNKTHLISATSSLIWAFYRLLQQQMEDSSASILSIDGSAAHEATHVFTAKPIIKKLRKRKSWNPIHKYRGSCEYLIWGQVAGAAITGFTTCADLIRPGFGHVALQRFLQLDLIRKSAHVAALRRALAAQAKTLNLEIAVAVGELARRLGLKPNSSRESISLMIFAILQGWVVRLPSGFLEDHDQVELTFDGFILSFAHGLSHDALQVLPGLMAGLKKAWADSVGKAHADVEKQFGPIQ